MYKCINCGKELEKESLDFSQSVKCPFCSGRVLIKIRPSVSKKVKAE